MNLNQITVSVKDVEQSIAYYQKLGLKLIVKSLPDYARFNCPGGDATFSLHKAETTETEKSVWIYFEENDLDNKVKHLQQQGFVFDELPQDKPWLWREARLRDLDNNVLILYFAGDMRKNPPWKIEE